MDNPQFNVNGRIDDRDSLLQLLEFRKVFGFSRSDFNRGIIDISLG